MDSTLQRDGDVISFLKSDEFCESIRAIVKGEIKSIQRQMDELKMQLEVFKETTPLSPPFKVPARPKKLNMPEGADEMWTEKVCVCRSVVHVSKNKLKYLVQALYDFTPQEQGELEFKRGDVITVTDRSDQHWWHGEIGHRKGLFPATYVTPYHT